MKISSRNKNKKLQKLLARCDKIDLLLTISLIDRALSDSTCVRPLNCDFPPELFGNTEISKMLIYPWELETLLLEAAMVTPTPGIRRGNLDSWMLVGRIFSLIREIENIEYDGGDDSTYLFRHLTRMGLRQFWWQSMSWEAPRHVRWLSILNTNDLANSIERSLGFSIINLVFVGMMLKQAFEGSRFIQHPIASEGDLVSQPEMDLIISQLSVPFDKLANFARSSAFGPRSLIYRANPLRRLPMIGLTVSGLTRYICPILKLLEWRITSGLYYDAMGNVGRDAGNKIGDSFEIYVRDLFSAKFLGWQITGNVEIGSKSKSRKSPDVVITSESGTLEYLIECKTAKISQKMNSNLGDNTDRNFGVEKISYGVYQLCEFAYRAQNGFFKNYPKENVQDPVLIVVTLDDWLFLGNDVLTDIRVKADALLGEKGMPSSADRVVICNIEELEKLVSYFDSNNVRTVLRKALQPEYSGWTLGGVVNAVEDGKLEEVCFPLKDRLTQFVTDQGTRAAGL